MKIDIDGFIGLIVCRPTGVTWESQTYGVACGHPQVEGFFIPIPGTEVTPNLDKVHDLLCWGPHPYTEDDLTKIDDALGEDCRWLSLDRARLDILGEAWIPVVIGSADKYHPLGKCEGMRGIFTYSNCD